MNILLTIRILTILAKILHAEGEDVNGTTKSSVQSVLSGTTQPNTRDGLQNLEQKGDGESTNGTEMARQESTTSYANSSTITSLPSILTSTDHDDLDYTIQVSDTTLGYQYRGELFNIIISYIGSLLLNYYRNTVGQ